MKIKNVTGKLIENNPIVYTKKDVSGKVVDFKKQLENITYQNHEEVLINLANNIFQQGDVISKRCDLKELKKYKELISLLFSEIVHYGFEYGKQSTFDRNGRQKIYANIRMVNEKLDILAKELLKEQKEQLSILKIVEDIRGLILDVLM